MMMNNVLVIGSGGREHALCWRLKQSPSVAQVFCAPGNGGIAQDATCVELKTPREVIDFVQESGIGLVVIGPEQPLVDGWADALRAAGIAVFGPAAAAARLEGSKGFMKDICRKYGIPTAAYGLFHDFETAQKFLDGVAYPIVIKADGLAAGKGVIIAADRTIALQAINDMFSGQFGAAGERVIIEEFLDGEEASFFALCDGQTAAEFGYAQDHKRAYDGDEGPNTGGMGAYSPAPVLTENLRREVMQTIIRPTVEAMKKEGCTFTGVLFAGLMLTKDGPRLLEYNVRFGDPETQALMMRFTGDLYRLLLSAAQGRLDASLLSFSPQAAVCVVMAAKGYPGAYEKNTVIGGLDRAAGVEHVKIFHAGTQRRGEEIIATGGRVLGVTALGDSIAQAKDAAYKAIDRIDWPQGFCRRDIGWRAIGG